MVIGVLCPSTSEAINFYRANGAFLPMIGEFPGVSVYALHGRSNFLEAFNFIDVLVINNPVPRQSGDNTFLRMIKDAKERGIKVVLDYDDYFFEVHPYSPAFSHFNIPEVRLAIKTIMNEADTITVATDFLNKEYDKLLTEQFGAHPPIVTINNAWNDYMLDFADVTPEGAKPRVAWRGASFHQDDLYSVHKQLNAFMEDVRFTMYSGDKYPFINPNHNQVKWTTLQQYFINFCNSKLDYLLTPLIETPFNRAKSNISWIEATIAGAATVAPIYLPEFDQPGVIRYSGEKGFAEVLKGIKTKKYDKEYLVEQSRAALENYRLSKINALRYQVVKDLVSAELTAV